MRVTADRQTYESPRIEGEFVLEFVFEFSFLSFTYLRGGSTHILSFSCTSLLFLAKRLGRTGQTIAEKYYFQWGNAPRSVNSEFPSVFSLWNDFSPVDLTSVDSSSLLSFLATCLPLLASRFFVPSHGRSGTWRKDKRDSQATARDLVLENGTLS